MLGRSWGGRALAILRWRGYIAHGGAGARGFDTGYAAKAFGAFDDVLFWNVQPWRAVAKDLAAIFVNPLPLGHGRRSNANGQRKYEQLDEFHGSSVARQLQISYEVVGGT